MLHKVVGCNKTAASSLKAAKIVQKKFVFHLDNVKDSPSCSDIESYVTDQLNVGTISCFTSKSWVRMEKEDDTPCCAFRVCVKFEDKKTVLDSALWPVGVIVREWRFKEKNKDGAQ